MIPKSMIERIEVVKGGGSVLLYADAVAGTVNIITREPVQNSSGVGGSSSSSMDRPQIIC